MTDKPPAPPGNVYSLNETAAKLHMSRRALQEIIKRLPFYAKNGKVYLFSDDDIGKIWDGMREESNERLRVMEDFKSAARGTAGSRLRELLSKPTGKPHPSLYLQGSWRKRGTRK